MTSKDTRLHRHAPLGCASDHHLLDHRHACQLLRAHTRERGRGRERERERERERDTERETERERECERERERERESQTVIRILAQLLHTGGLPGLQGPRCTLKYYPTRTSTTDLNHSSRTVYPACLRSGFSCLPICKLTSKVLKM